MNGGISSGNVYLDLAILILLPVVTVFAQRLGLVAVLVKLGEALASLKPAPAPEPAPQPQPQPQPVAMTGMPAPVGAGPAWLLLLLPLLEAVIQQALALLKERLNREPTFDEQAAEVKRITEQFRRGKLRFLSMGNEELSNNDLEQVTSGKAPARRLMRGICRCLKSRCVCGC